MFTVKVPRLMGVSLCDCILLRFSVLIKYYLLLNLKHVSLGSYSDFAGPNTGSYL